LNIIKVKAITVIAFTFSYTEKQAFFNSLSKAFNDYSDKNGLDIQLEIELLTPDNSTAMVGDQLYTMDTILKKKSQKHDLYIYNGPYTHRFGEHFVDLRNYISEDHINKFEKTILSTVMYEDKLVGMPLSLDVSTLYSNQMLLDKYGKEVPRTWDELIDTARFILQKEKEENPNEDLVGYNGHINVNSAIPSFYEFSHSFRDSNESPHPPINSQQVINALEKFKYLKEQISSDSIFSSPDIFTIEKLFMGGAIFLKFWYLEHTPLYTASALPGNKVGVSGTLSIPNNMGINKYIGEERIKATVEVVKFLTSKETQKNYIIKNHQMSAITSLYSDKEVCEIVDCRVIIDAMPLNSLLFEKDGYGNDYYLYKSREYMLDFMYGNITAKETVEKIHNILNVQNLSIKTDKTVVGLLVIIIVTVTLLIQLISLVLLFIKSFNKYYYFLTKDMWCISVFGSMMIMASIFTLYGDVTPFKCHIKLICLLTGYYICILPIFCKLITNVPDTNRYSTWVQSHLYLFLFLMASVEAILNLSRLLIPLYEVEKIIVPDGDNFNKCVKQSGFGVVIYCIEIIWIMIVLLCSLFLLFIEWNLKSSLYQVRCITASIFATLLSITVYIIFNKLYIKIHIVYYLFCSCSLYILSLSNYTFIYGLEMVQTLVRNEKEEEYEQILKNLKLDIVKSSTITEDNDYSTNEKIANENLYIYRKVSISQNNSSLHSEATRNTSYKKKSTNYLLQLHYKEDNEPSQN